MYDVLGCRNWKNLFLARGRQIVKFCDCNGDNIFRQAKKDTNSFAKD